MTTPYSQGKDETIKPIGRLVSVTGSQAITLLNSDMTVDQLNSLEIATLVAIHSETSIALGFISSMNVPMPSHEPGERELQIVELEFVGELQRNSDGTIGSFKRGLSSHPTLGAHVFATSNDELAAAYSFDDEKAIKVGTLHQDPSIPAMIKVDEMLGKHFAIVGTTGSGKSCTTALILRKVLERSPNAHIILLDPHNEYPKCFGDKAEMIRPDNLNLPFWLLTFEEIVEVLIGTEQNNREADIEVLRELIPIAKSRYGQAQRSESRLKLNISINEVRRFTVDMPVPYRISDLMSLLEDKMGSLDLKNALAPYKRLKASIERVTTDPRFNFMFGSLTVHDSMAEVISKLFRIPVNNKPIAIMDLSGLPSEVVNVVVSVICRMGFDLGLWSGGKIPLTIVCEEAHRYVPADQSLGFEPAKRAIAKIAKEGRKYGVSLCVVSQRPSELDPTILSQCNTIFTLRLSNDVDQQILRAATPDAAESFLEFLPAMGTAESIAFGEGVPLPTRIKFEPLPDKYMPRSTTAKFSTMWKNDISDPAYLSELVTRWRKQNKSDDYYQEDAEEDIGYDTPLEQSQETQPQTSQLTKNAESNNNHLAENNIKNNTEDKQPLTPGFDPFPEEARRRMEQALTDTSSYENSQQQHTNDSPTQSQQYSNSGQNKEYKPSGNFQSPSNYTDQNIGNEFVKNQQASIENNQQQYNRRKMDQIPNYDVYDHRANMQNTIPPQTSTQHQDSKDQNILRPGIKEQLFGIKKAVRDVFTGNDNPTAQNPNDINHQE